MHDLQDGVHGDGYPATPPIIDRLAIPHLDALHGHTKAMGMSRLDGRGEKVACVWWGGITLPCDDDEHRVPWVDHLLHGARHRSVQRIQPTSDGKLHDREHVLRVGLSKPCNHPIQLRFGGIEGIDGFESQRRR